MTPTTHGWQFNKMMLLFWLTTIVGMGPMLLPYLNGEKPFDYAAGFAVASVVIAHLNHSPLPSTTIRIPPVTSLLFLMIFIPFVLLSGCGGQVSGSTVYATALRLAKRMCVVVDALPMPADSSGGETDAGAAP